MKTLLRRMLLLHLDIKANLGIKYAVSSTLIDIRTFLCFKRGLFIETTSIQKCEDGTELAVQHGGTVQLKSHAGFWCEV